MTLSLVPPRSRAPPGPAPQFTRQSVWPRQQQGQVRGHQSPGSPHRPCAPTDRRVGGIPQCQQACGPRDGHTCISSSLRPGLPDLVHCVWPRKSHADGGEVAPSSPLCPEGPRPASPPHPRLSPRPHGDPEHAWGGGGLPGRDLQTRPSPRDAKGALVLSSGGGG